MRPSAISPQFELGTVVDLGNGDYSWDWSESVSAIFDCTLEDISCCLVAVGYKNDEITVLTDNAEIHNGTDAVGGFLFSSASFVTFGISVSGVEMTTGRYPGAHPDYPQLGFVISVMVKNQGVVRFVSSSFGHIDEILDLVPNPCWAIGDGDTVLPMTINGESPNKWAGWQSALPTGGVVRITGFNMPRTLTSYSGATPTTINAEGGQYGIEFAIPQDCDSVAIFDETFWLYIR